MNQSITFLAILLTILLSSSFQISAQSEIKLINPSFEGIPTKGGERMGVPIPPWIDCGLQSFPGESPPDIHSGEEGYFGVTTKPHDGVSYLGMVVRQNDTWECVSQMLTTDLKAGQCYSFSIYLAKSNSYYRDEDLSTRLAESCVLRIWGGQSYCHKKEVLAESTLVNNSSWKKFDFTFTPQQDHGAISLEAFYKTPVLFPYYGNLLVDAASDIQIIPCPGEEIVAEVEEIDEPKDVKPKAQPKEVAKVESPKKRILEDLDVDKLQEGQKIRIRNLYFEADQADVNSESNEVLDEIANFLKDHDNIRVEIGGHTNATPEHEYCDSLSNLRAKSVATRLIKKGVTPIQLEHRGYGKRKPVASNTSKEGRKKNQRVEIKILSLNG